ncbi:MAG: bifunctional acetate--CoA ligase family protein/GNAT family N-acetyltransferase [Chloroflexi bacterium]|nr:bifunctional acetate--CoA ligase family protein/GNAT family N-acetyltransferase [Chloroflexota bacterium]
MDTRKDVSKLPLSKIADRALDVLHYETRPLDALFKPKTVAVIGATDKPHSVGRAIFTNLARGKFRGKVFAVNPKHRSIQGEKCFRNIAAIQEPIELAVIVTPARTVPNIVKECADAGVKGAIIISAGFKEIGAAGAALERQVLENARRGGMRIIGPNCLGVMNPLLGFNATFAGAIAHAGNVGFISQSGALCTAVLDWSFRENVGFSAFVSIGSMLDVGWGDLITYLGDDAKTKSIVIYMETVGDARSFMSAAREVALTKPIIVIKAGRTQAAAHAAASHTGALTGSDEVLDAAFRRCGVLRVDSISDLFYMAEVLGKQPRPQGSRLMIVTNAGGPGVLATDALIDEGGELADLTRETMESLNQFLPAHWSRGNPIDILGDADPERYAQSIQIASRDPNADGLLVILAPQAMTDPTEIAQILAPLAQSYDKPILASWMGGAVVEKGEAILNQASIPTFGFPDTAARVFNYMWRSAYNLQGLYETPMLPHATEEGLLDRARARKIVDDVNQSGRVMLTEFESKQLLAAYGIPTVETRIARDEEAAARIADEIGYPVVVKLHSETITHKTDVGGVKLNLQDADAVRAAYREIQQAVDAAVGARHSPDLDSNAIKTGTSPSKSQGGQEFASASPFLGVTIQPMIQTRDAYELILGSSVDPQFGPVLLFGAGGQLVEIFRDHALALPPLNTTLARRVMEQTQIYRALRGVRGRAPVNLAALAELIAQFSQLVSENRRIKEIDINPLLASPPSNPPFARGEAGGLIALDARVVLHAAAMADEELPRLAIRGYPTRYVSEWTMKDGAAVTIRPIRPEDEPLIAKYHATISETSVYLRYFRIMKLSARTTHERLIRICFIDYDREMALVVEKQAARGAREIIAVGRLTKIHGTEDAEFAILVSDAVQGQGIGYEILRRLIGIGRDEKLKRIRAEILLENSAMQGVCKKLGFQLYRIEGGTVGAVLEL